MTVDNPYLICNKLEISGTLCKDRIVKVFIPRYGSLTRIYGKGITKNNVTLYIQGYPENSIHDYQITDTDFIDVPDYSDPYFKIRCIDDSLELYGDYQFTNSTKMSISKQCLSHL